MATTSRSDRPADVELPEGWTWDRVEAQRAKWGIADNMVPAAVVPGACVAWCTINSVRQTALPGIAPDVGGLLRTKAAAPIKPKAPQKPCDAGLFSDSANQQELFR